jgi:opacity protein-like surface antigen
MIRTTLISASLALLAAPVLAGNTEAPTHEAPVAVATTVSHDASWTGFYAGAQYSFGDAEVDSGGDQDYEAFGVHGGYLHDFGSFVLGGELDYSQGDVETSAGDVDADIFRLKAIAGYDLGKFLPYVTAGIANVDLGASGEDTSEFFGVGVNYAVNDDWRVGAEYLIDSANDFDNSGVDVDLDSFNLRVGYSF